MTRRNEGFRLLAALTPSSAAP